MSAIDLTAKGWTPTLNGTAQTDPYSFASLDLDFATNLTLNDNISNSNLITFTRGSTGTYVDANGVIQTATANTPRFDHDPVTNESLGLLVEESRTNEMSLSVIRPDNNGVYTQWTPTNGATIQPYAALAPDGTFTAALVTFPNSASIPRINRQTSIVSGTRTISCWIKAKTGTVTIRVGNNSDYGQDQTIGTEWTRIVEEVPSSSNFAGIYCSSTISSAEFYAWGFQQEAGSFPTSYIPTPATFTSRASTATYYDANGVIQTAGVDVARDDSYFPDENGNFISAGLLLEESATNGVVLSDSWGGGMPRPVGGPGTGIINDGKYEKIGVTLNYGIAPDGTLTSLKLSDLGQHAITGVSVEISIFGVTEPSATINTFSTFVRKIGSTDSFTISSYTSMNTSVTFTFSTESFSIGYGPWHIAGSEGYQKLSNGWYRIWWSYDRTKISPETATLWAKIRSTDPNFQLELWGAQKNAGLGVSSYISSSANFTSRNSTATYYDSNGIIQTAAIDVERDNAYLPDENGVFGRIGTLVESGSTNYVQNSENASLWLNVGGQSTNVSNDITDAPDGNTTADLIYGANGSLTSKSLTSTNFNLFANWYVVASIFVKKVPGSKYGFINLNLSAVGSGFDRINLNLDTGEIAFSNISGYVEKFPNGWYRLVAAVRNTSGASQTWNPNAVRIFAVTSSGDEQGSGSGTGSTTDGVYVWGAQVETFNSSDRATSYIPTGASIIVRAADVYTTPFGSRAADVSTSATVTRAPDVVSITGTNFSSWYNQSEGSFIIEHRHDGVDSDGYLFEIGGTSGNYAYSHAAHFISSTSASGYQSRSYFYGGGYPSSLFYFTKSTPTKVLYGYKSGDYAAGADSVLSTTSQSSWSLSVPTVDNYLGLGRRRDGTRSFQQLRIARLTYYPVRLPDATLQALTL